MKNYYEIICIFPLYCPSTSTIPPIKLPKSIPEVVISRPPKPRFTEKNKHPSLEESQWETNNVLFHIMDFLKSIDANVARYVDHIIAKDQESSEDSSTSEGSEVRPKKSTRRSTSKHLPDRNETEEGSVEEGNAEEEEEEVGSGHSRASSSSSSAFPSST